MKRTLAALLLPFACSAPPRAPSPPPERLQAAPASRAEPEPARGESRPLPAPELSPSILLPSPGSGDAELMRAGRISIWKHDLVDRLQETEPVFLRQLQNDLVLDALLAEQAERHGIRIDAGAIERAALAEEQRLREQVARELHGSATFEDYVRRQFGLEPAEFRNWQRLALARDRYRQYVVRYLALRADRVSVRVISSADKKLLEDLERRIREGADFATLALRHSDDESRRDGGLLPPLHRGSRHPVVGKAFELQAGEVSPILVHEGAGAPRYYLVYCVRRMPGRDVEFAAVREELDRESELRPLERSDLQAVFDRLLQEAQSLPPGPPRR